MAYNKHLIEAIATLMGSIIGAGILGIPYVAAKAGFLIGLFWIIGLGLAILLINLYLGEIVLRTKGFHQLTGYAEKYLGKNGRSLMTFSMIVGIYGALLAYMIGVGNSLHELFPALTSTQFSLIFFLVVTVLVLIGLNIIEKLEVLMGVIIVVIVAIICSIIFFSPNFNVANLGGYNLPLFFVPYGVVLFAYIGTAAIPEMHEELFNNRKLLKKAIILGSCIPIVIYLLFTLVVLASTGTATTGIATIGLGNMFGSSMIIFANWFAIFAMATSFLALALAMVGMFHYDFGLNHLSSWSLTSVIPLMLFMIGFKDFISTIEFSGSITSALAGILIVLMHWKAEKLGDRVPEYAIKRSYFIGGFLLVLFIFGIFYEFWRLV